MTESPYRVLHSEGGHLVLCDKSKRALRKGWQKHRADPGQAQGHKDDGGLVGLVTASLSLVVVDCDASGSDEAAAEALGPPLATVDTPKGRHMYYPHPGGEVGNKKWVGGDIRGDKGYVILWKEAAVAGLLGGRASWPSPPDLSLLPGLPGAPSNGGSPAAQLYKTRAAKIRNAPEGSRNDTLNREVFAWAANGGDSEDELGTFRKAALDSGLEATEVGTTIASAQGDGRAEYAAHVGGAAEAVELEAAMTSALGEYDMLLKPGAWGHGGRSPVADAIRLLAYAPERLLLVSHGDDERAELLVATETGRWSRSRPELLVLLHEATAKWLAPIGGEIAGGAVSRADLLACQRHAAVSRTLKGLAECEAHAGAANLFMEKKRCVPPALTVCQAPQLDELARYIGAANGVYGLVERRMLDESEAREKLVTRSVRDPIIPDAKHADVDFLFAHLPERERDFLLGSLGWSLGGNPARRLLLLVSAPGGGKTTLLNVLTRALGDARDDGYGLTIDADELMTRRWAATGHQDGLYGGQWARIATTEEPRQYSGRARFNEALLKHHAGGGSVSYSAKGEKSRGGSPWRATHLIAMNPSGLTTLALSDEALADRAKILRYQPIPEEDRNPGKADSMPADAAVRQAMLALLLRSYPDEPDEPPADIPSVQTMRAERRHATIGDAGTWLVEHVEVTDDPADFLFRVDALDAAASACGGRNAEGEIDGRSERELTAVMASYISELPAATTKRCPARANRPERGWRGVRLKNAEALLSRWLRVPLPLPLQFDDDCPRCSNGRPPAADPAALAASQQRQSDAYGAYCRYILLRSQSLDDLDDLDELSDKDKALIREVRRHAGCGPAPELPDEPSDEAFARLRAKAEEALARKERAGAGGSPSSQLPPREEAR